MPLSWKASSECLLYLSEAKCQAPTLKIPAAENERQLPTEKCFWKSFKELVCKQRLAITATESGSDGQAILTNRNWIALYICACTSWQWKKMLVVAVLVMMVVEAMMTQDDGDDDDDNEDEEGNDEWWWWWPSLTVMVTMGHDNDGNDDSDDTVSYTHLRAHET